MRRVLLGTKYLRVNKDNKLEVIRLVRIKNQNSFVLKSTTGEVIRLNDEQLKEYTVLNPDAYICFSIVKLQNNAKDVIITLHTREDVLAGNNTPKVICRQSIFDFFANQVIKSNVQYVGVSVTPDTCPADIPYQAVLACDGVISSSIVNVYKDDMFENILKLINTADYDTVLANLVKEASKSPNVVGYESNLEDLMINTGFMYDFLITFEIQPVNFAVNDGAVPLESQIAMLEDILKHKMHNVVITRYARDIDLDKIQHKYLLISDITAAIYIVTYDEGEYVNRSYMSMEDHRDFDLLVSLKIQNRMAKNS